MDTNTNQVMGIPLEYITEWVPGDENHEKEVNWIISRIRAIGSDKIRHLAKVAAKARIFAYAPYSGFKVGAALLTVIGEIFDGFNIERATYSEGTHAEENSITNALLHHAHIKSGREFVDVIVVCSEGNSCPCGRCRQIILEHCSNALIVVADIDGNILGITSILAIMPHAFTPAHLKKDL